MNIRAKIGRALWWFGLKSDENGFYRMGAIRGRARLRVRKTCETCGISPPPGAQCMRDDCPARHRHVPSPVGDTIDAGPMLFSQPREPDYRGSHEMARAMDKSPWK
ncbi:MAG: hypothetical protein Q7S17_07685 [Xanthobacteraceae bacterium]|nr:hypothetical protein [Xanthobacteraceae bacterium]